MITALRLERFKRFAANDFVLKVFQIIFRIDYALSVNFNFLLGKINRAIARCAFFIVLSNHFYQNCLRFCN